MKEAMPSPAELLTKVRETFGVIEENIKMVRGAERAVELAELHLKNYSKLLDTLNASSEEGDRKMFGELRVDVDKCMEILGKTAKFRTDSLSNLETMVGLVGQQMGFLSSILEGKDKGSSP
jgi:hypothetical protein